MKEIEFQNVTKSYDGKINVLNSMNLSVHPGERMILLGPSGCGKSTTLRIIAGLESITSGTLRMNEKVVNDIPGGERNIAMVFQNYALYPHMTVWQNLSYGLRVNKVSKDEIEQRNRLAIEMLELQGLENRKPRDLSGGQRQRVALARAVVKNTDYLLLDEPLSNLDAQLRMRARQELVRLHEKFHMTMVYVTHDQTEAMTVADRIVVMNGGDVQMIGTPDEVYHNPKNLFTARFIGAPPMNLFRAVFQDGSLHMEETSTHLPIDGEMQSYLEKSGSDLILGIRPERMEIREEFAPDTLDVVIDYLEDYGSRVSLSFRVQGKEHTIITGRHNYRVGDVIHIHFPQEHMKLFNRDTEENIRYL